MVNFAWVTRPEHPEGPPPGSVGPEGPKTSSMIIKFESWFSWRFSISFVRKKKKNAKQVRCYISHTGQPSSSVCYCIERLSTQVNFSTVWNMNFCPALNINCVRADHWRLQSKDVFSQPCFCMYASKICSGVFDKLSGQCSANHI